MPPHDRRPHGVQAGAGVEPGVGRAGAGAETVEAANDRTARDGDEGEGGVIQNGCYDCTQTTGGCGRHSVTFVVDQNAALRTGAGEGFAMSLAAHEACERRIEVLEAALQVVSERCNDFMDCDVRELVDAALASHKGGG